MAEAYAKTTGATPFWAHSAIVARGFAAEIRALQHHILPDEPPMTLVIQGNAVAKALYMQRERLRAVLTAAAKRAEGAGP